MAHWPFALLHTIPLLIGMLENNKRFFFLETKLFSLFSFVAFKRMSLRLVWRLAAARFHSETAAGLKREPS